MQGPRPSLHLGGLLMGKQVIVHSALVTLVHACRFVLEKKSPTASEPCVYACLESCDYPLQENKCRVRGPLWKQDYSL